jgi:two-component system OmpR family response regulator
MPRILLIDDDQRLGPPLASYFARFDFALEQAMTPSEALRRLRTEPFDAVVLDVMLPEMDGFAVCRRLREESDIPIVMLTARGELTDRVVGLELGADDYVPKPFEPRELVARLQSVLRRGRGRGGGSGAAAGAGAGAGAGALVTVTASAGQTGAREGAAAGAPGALTHSAADLLQPLRFDGLVIDPARRSVLRAGEPVALTGTEFELLLRLAREPGRVIGRDELLAHLRGHEAELYTRAIDIAVSRLRGKLAPLDCIRTMRNAGYAFALPPAVA